MSIVLDDELKGIINNALTERTPMVLASVDDEGRPRLTFRGSLQTFSDDQVGFWARNAEGGTMENIAGNPHVSMMMRNPDTRVVLQLMGRATRVEGVVRDQVYANAMTGARACAHNCTMVATSSVVSGNATASGSPGSCHDSP